MRWRIESRYDDIKNKLQIENFSGTTPIAVLQDFYATMLLTNMVAFAQIDSDDKLKKDQDDKVHKHEYKTNISMLISTIKLDFIAIFMEPSSRKRSKKLALIMQKILQNTVPIRNERYVDRRRKHFALKFHNNLKNL